MKKIFPLLSVIAAFIFQSCTDKEISSPVINPSNLTQQNAVAVNLKSPSPGDYNVNLYVENGDTSTTEFNGYVFTFKSNGSLLAKVGTTTYTGKWESGNNGKQLKLDIKGTPALEDADKTWDVVQITDTQISLKDNSGKFGDKLVFVKN